MNIYDVLKDDHRRIRGLIREMRRGDCQPGRARDCLQELMEMLEQHSLNEDALFYQKLDDQADDEAIVEEARIEHERIDALLAEMVGMEPGPGGFRERLDDLEELLSAHVGMEEGEMFAMGRRVIGPDDAERIGNEMYQREQGVLGRVLSGGLPREEANPI